MTLWPSSVVNCGPRRLSPPPRITERYRNSQPTCSTAFCSSPADRPDLQSQAQGLATLDFRPGLRLSAGRHRLRVRDLVHPPDALLRGWQGARGAPLSDWMEPLRAALGGDWECLGGWLPGPQDQLGGSLSGSPEPLVGWP